MLDALLGGGLALAGVVLAQWWQGRRERNRWRREASYDQRRDAYVAFLNKIEHYRRVTDKWALYQHGPPPSVSADEPDFLMPFWDLITPIKVYCSREAQRRAEVTVKVLDRYVSSDGLSEDVGLELDTAIDAYIEQVRIDLDIQPAPANRPQLSRKAPGSLEPNRVDDTAVESSRDSAT